MFMTNFKTALFIRSLDISLISFSLMSLSMNSKSFDNSWNQSSLTWFSVCFSYIFFMVSLLSLVRMWWGYISLRYVKWLQSFQVTVSKWRNYVAHLTCPPVSQRNRAESTTSMCASCLSVMPDQASAECNMLRMRIACLSISPTSSPCR